MNIWILWAVEFVPSVTFMNMHLLHEDDNRAGRCEAGQCYVLMFLVAEILFVIEIIFSILQ